MVTCAHGSVLLACGSVQPSEVSFDPESLPSAGVLSSPHAWLLELQSLAAARMEWPLRAPRIPTPCRAGGFRKRRKRSLPRLRLRLETQDYFGVLCVALTSQHVYHCLTWVMLSHSVGLLAPPHLSEE